MHCSSSQVYALLQTPFLTSSSLLFSSSPAHPFRSSQHLTLSSCRISHLILPLLFLYRSLFSTTCRVVATSTSSRRPQSCIFFSFHTSPCSVTLCSPRSKRKISSSRPHATIVDLRTFDPHSSGASPALCTCKEAFAGKDYLRKTTH